MVKCIKEYVLNDDDNYIIGEVYVSQSKSVDRITVITNKGKGKSFGIEEIKEYFSIVTKKEEFELLKQAAQPMINYLNKFYDPMTFAVITEGYVKIVVEEMGVPL